MVVLAFLGAVTGLEAWLCPRSIWPSPFRSARSDAG